MSDDLVKRLRNLDTHPEGAPCKAADRIEELEAKLVNIERELLRRVKDAEYFKKAAGSGTSQRREHYRMHALSEALGAVRKIVKG
jgi:hypothetical protein